MDPKTRWYNQRSAVLRGEGRQLGEDRPAVPSRARVLRNTVEVDRAAPMRVVPMPSAGGPRVQPGMGRRATRADEVRIEFDPARYGLHQVETMEEREERHRHQIAELQAKLADAEQRAEAAGKDGYDRGVKAGIQQGIEQARAEVEAEYQERVEMIGALLQKIADNTGDYYHAVEKRVAGFAMTIARHIVESAADQYENIATIMAREALKQASERSTVTLLCHPDDERELVAADADLKAVSEGIREIDVRTSPRVKRGGIILETGGGSIDATIDTVLAELRGILLDDDNPSEDKA